LDEECEDALETELEDGELVLDDCLEFEDDHPEFIELEGEELVDGVEKDELMPMFVMDELLLTEGTD